MSDVRPLFQALNACLGYLENAHTCLQLEITDMFLRFSHCYHKLYPSAWEDQRVRLEYNYQPGSYTPAVTFDQVVIPCFGSYTPAKCMMMRVIAIGNQIQTRIMHVLSL